MEQTDLSFYERLARWGWPRSYRGKLLLVAFLGTHVPLIVAVAYVLTALSSPEETWPILIVLSVATLAGTAGTLTGLHHLLRPLPRTARALRRYAETGVLPSLPANHEDEAGRLMHDTQTLLNRLDRLARFRDRLFSIVIHDLRSSATSVLLATDVLKDAFTDDDPLTESDRELVEMIRRSMQQQITLIKTLLDQVRQDTVRLDVKAETVHPAALLRRVADKNRLAAERCNIDFHFELESDIDPLYTDPRLAGQVLQNLVGNAVTFSPPGGTVVLSAHRQDKHVSFSVRDHGTGLTQDELDTLFEPFEQGSSSPSRVTSPAELSASESAESFSSTELPEDEGFGLGLWIAQTFTELLGGSVHADSTPGEGTTFEVRLPVHANDQRLQKQSTLSY